MTAASLLVASRGRWPSSGLHRYTRSASGTWSPTMLAQVDDLSCLAWHPHLPVVYGTAGTESFGRIVGWALTRDGNANELFHTSSGGIEPCHLAVDPTGRLLVAANYTTSSIGVWQLDAAGAITDDRWLLELTGAGSGADPDRQHAPHPHQTVFAGDLLYIVDLGADLIRRYQVHPERPTHQALQELSPIRVPAGTGPRHMAVLPDGDRLVVDGELAETVVICAVDPDRQVPPIVVPSTRHDRASVTRHLRNHAGDLILTPDATHAIVANRGYDTVGVVALQDDPRLVAELDAGVKWPQQFSWLDGQLLVAGWDSGRISVLTPGRESDELLAPAAPLIECDAPGWVLVEHHRQPEPAPPTGHVE